MKRDVCIVPVCALRDNYIWMIQPSGSHAAWAVDPGEAGPVLRWLSLQSLDLGGILLTHHHADHAGGIPALLEAFPGIPVFASEKTPHACVSVRVHENERIECGPLCFQVMNIPGHTLDHVAFFGHEALFCGDTLFSAGCGRVFEGTPGMMFSTLNKITTLPAATRVYCGHEYTAANLQFAQQVEPHNSHIAEKIRMIHPGSCSLPSRLSDEMKINPFLRCEEAAVQQAVMQQAGYEPESLVEVFRILREWKNSCPG